MDLFERNHPNLRQALSWYLETDPQKGLALAGALRAFWSEGDHIDEGRNWLRRLLDKDPRPTSARARALLTLGTISEQNSRAKPLVRESLDIYRSTGPDNELAISLNNMGVLLDQTGQWEEAAEMYMESLQLERRTNRPLIVAHNLAQLLASVEGDREQAYALVGESLDAARSSGSILWLGSAWANSAYVRHVSDDIKGARKAAEVALGFADQLKEVPNLSWKHFAHGVLADLAVENRDLTVGSKHILQALESLLSESNYLMSLSGWHICTHLIRWARVQLLKDNATSAATVLAAVDIAANRQGYVFKPEMQNMQIQVLDQLRGGLSPEEHTTAWDRGAHMTLQQASAYVLDHQR